MNGHSCFLMSKHWRHFPRLTIPAKFPCGDTACIIKTCFPSAVTVYTSFPTQYFQKNGIYASHTPASIEKLCVHTHTFLGCISMASGEILVVRQTTFLFFTSPVCLYWEISEVFFQQCLSQGTINYTRTVGQFSELQNIITEQSKASLLPTVWQPFIFKKYTWESLHPIRYLLSFLCLVSRPAMFQSYYQLGIQNAPFAFAMSTFGLLYPGQVI